MIRIGRERGVMLVMIGDVTIGTVEGMAGMAAALRDTMTVVSEGRLERANVRAMSARREGTTAEKEHTRGLAVMTRKEQGDTEKNFLQQGIEMTAGVMAHVETEKADLRTRIEGEGMTKTGAAKSHILDGTIQVALNDLIVVIVMIEENATASGTEIMTGTGTSDETMAETGHADDLRVLSGSLPNFNGLSQPFGLIISSRDDA